MIAFIPGHNARVRGAPVTLPPAPWDGDTLPADPRPETYPRMTMVKSRPPAALTHAQIVEAIRREWVKARAGA